MRSRNVTLAFIALLAITALFSFTGTPGQFVTAQSGTASATKAVATMIKTMMPTVELTTDASHPANLRIVHASPDAPAVDVYLNGVAKWAGAKFGNYTDFMQVPSGYYKVELRAAGALATAAPLVSTNIVLLPGVSADLIALGLTSGGGTSKLKLTAFLVNRAPTQGKARIEFIHAVPDAPAVDILQDNKPVVTEIKFGKMADSPVHLDPGTALLQIVPTGKKAPVVLDLSNTQVNADTIYTVIAAGQLGRNSVKAIILTTTPADKSAISGTMLPTMDSSKLTATP